MRRQRLNVGGLAFFAFVIFSFATPGGVKAADIVIGVSSQNRVHFHVARAVCRTITRAIQGLECEPYLIEKGDAPGPLSVLSDVSNGAIEFGIVSSDWAHYVYTGSGPAKFLDARFNNLRTLFTLHEEPLGLIVRRDSGISSVADLAGKRVNIANPGSYQRLLMEMIMERNGWSREDFQMAEELSVSEQALALCHNQIQAMVVSVSHPNADVAKTLRVCNAKLLDVDGAGISKLIADHPYFYEMKIGAGHYSDQKDIKTFGLRVLAVSSSEIDRDLSGSIVSAVVDNASVLPKLHPALRSVSPRSLMGDGNVLPLHDGALLYFRSNGLM
jgi:uncharacterized protein